MTKILRILHGYPILSPLIITLAAALLHLATYRLYEETNFASVNFIISAMLFGTIAFPIYYAFTFAYFFVCLYYINSGWRNLILTSLIIYIILTLPFIDMSLITFGF
ncbi:MAG TPA: hypothetical protein VHP30_04895 [Ignavibacteriales bacterium]|nr:hypothetical protein [Ignavibacteriales bacterium]